MGHKAEALLNQMPVQGVKLGKWMRPEWAHKRELVSAETRLGMGGYDRVGCRTILRKNVEYRKLAIWLFLLTNPASSELFSLVSDRMRKVVSASPDRGYAFWKREKPSQMRCARGGSSSPTFTSIPC